MKTLKEIKGRCYVDEAGHWIWRGATQDGQSIPVIQGPNLSKGGVQQPQTGARVVWQLNHQKAIPPKYRCYAECFVPLCLNPGCVVASTTTMMHAKRQKAGLFMKSIRRTMANRRSAEAFSKITAEMYQEIISSSETGPVIGARLGITRHLVSKVRTGKTGLRFQPIGGMFTGLLAANTQWSKRA